MTEKGQKRIWKHFEPNMFPVALSVDQSVLDDIVTKAECSTLTESLLGLLDDLGHVDLGKRLQILVKLRLRSITTVVLKPFKKVWTRAPASGRMNWIFNLDWTPLNMLTTDLDLDAEAQERGEGFVTDQK